VGEAGVAANLFLMTNAKVLKTAASSDTFLGGFSLPLLLDMMEIRKSNFDEDIQMP
jgi:hypothetical protein